MVEERPLTQSWIEKKTEYGTKEIADRIGRRSPIYVIYPFWYLTHEFAEPPEINLEILLKNLFEKIRECEGFSIQHLEKDLLDEIQRDSYTNKIHRHYGLLAKIRDTTTIFNWIYREELIKEVGPNIAKETAIFMKESYIMDEPSEKIEQFSYLVPEIYHITILTRGKPLTQIESRKKLMQQIIRMDNALKSLASFHCTEQGQLDLHKTTLQNQLSIKEIYCLFHKLFSTDWQCKD